MRVIKPGKLGPISKTGKAKERQEATDTQPARDIWDDYFVEKKGKKKKEYAKGSGNRMLPVSEKDRGEGDKAGVECEGAEVEIPKPRDDFDELEKRFGYTFQSRDLLSRALTHRSALGMKERADYERLEFLGDAVLDLAVAHLLSDAHPDAREGELSKMRAALVNTHALAKIGREIEIGPYIRLGRGEYSSGGNDRPSILADVMEALIGAMYRDSGYEVALKTIDKIFGEELEQVTPYDPKTELQEVLHIAGSEPPNYLLELVEGPEHAPTFVTVVVVDGEICGRGRGPTKKGAQQEAAAEALARMSSTCTEIELVDGQKEIVLEALLTSQLINPNNPNQTNGNG
jgi:ribonuclease-3